MKQFSFAIIICVLCATLCGCGKQLVYVPTPVPCPKVKIPPPPDYPVLTKESTPRQTMEYFLLKDMMKSQRIEQLEKLLSGYQ
jgi:hypothetical protein